MKHKEILIYFVQYSYDAVSMHTPLEVKTILICSVDVFQG